MGMLDGIADFGKTLADTVMDTELAKRTQGMMAPSTTSPQQQRADLAAMDVFGAPQPQQPPMQPQPEPPRSQMEAAKRATPKLAERGVTAQDTLAEFLKVEENDELYAGDMSKVRHKSAEGGLDTVGYGHKLTPEEDKSGKIYGYKIKDLTPEAIDHILELDMKVHTRRAKKVVEGKGADWSKMSPRERAMMVEMSFNGVLPKFTKFIGAIDRGDYATARTEYERTYKDENNVTKKLDKRNNAFYRTFLSDDAIKANP